MRSNPFSPTHAPSLCLSTSSLPSVRSFHHPLLNTPTASTCYAPTPHPEGIIFTLTTSINLTPSCTQTLVHTRALTHTHTHTNLRVDHACTHTSPPIQYQSQVLRSLDLETDLSSGMQKNGRLPAAAQSIHCP